MRNHLAQGMWSSYFTMQGTIPNKLKVQIRNTTLIVLDMEGLFYLYPKELVRDIICIMLWLLILLIKHSREMSSLSASVEVKASPHLVYRSSH